MKHGSPLDESHGFMSLVDGWFVPSACPHLDNQGRGEMPRTQTGASKYHLVNWRQGLSVWLWLGT